MIRQACVNLAIVKRKHENPERREERFDSPDHDPAVDDERLINPLSMQRRTLDEDRTMKKSALIAALVAVLLVVSIPQARSEISSPVAVVTGALSPNEVKDYPFTIANALDDYLLHVTVQANDPEFDRLDITIGSDTWTDLQGDWWDSVYWGPLAAGDHTVTATTSTDATNQVGFTVEFYTIPTSPFTVQGTFPPDPYNNVAYINLNLTEAGYYTISAKANTGNFALVPGGQDSIDVVHEIKATLQFGEAGIYEFQVQADVLGTGDATAWSFTIEAAKSELSLNVTIIEGCEEIGPGSSCMFRANATASDGGQPEIRYDWTTSGGCFVTETGECVSSFLGQYANWTAPQDSDMKTYQVTVEASADGYESGTDSWPIVVPEFPFSAASMVLVLVLALVAFAVRRSRNLLRLRQSDSQSRT